MITLLLLACTHPASTFATEPVQGFDSATGDTETGDTDTAPDTDTDTDSGHADTDTDTARETGDTARDTSGDTAPADTATPPDTADTAAPSVPECWDGTWVDEWTGAPVDLGVGLVGTGTAAWEAATWSSADLFMDESTHTGTATLATCGTAFRFYCSEGLVTMTADPGTSDFGGTVTFTATQIMSGPYGVGMTDTCQFYSTGTIDAASVAAQDVITVRF